MCITDDQVYGSPSYYGDKKMKALQKKLHKKIEIEAELTLHKTYNYWRMYMKGAVLRIHKDRPACEISITLDIGGDPWDIWLLDKNENPIKVRLQPGDAMLYEGCDIWHWRAKFTKDNHAQVFMHFVDKNGPFAWAKDDNKNE